MISSSSSLRIVGLSAEKMTTIRTLVCDVGSGSVRVAILEYTPTGILNSRPLAHLTEAIPIHNVKTDFYEQNTNEIWEAFCRCSRHCLIESGLERIDSIAFSSTCSLVIVMEDEKNQQDNNSKPNDVIMWMDHRAKEQANRITESDHRVLQQFGGCCSPEFSLAKLVWLHDNDRQRFESAHAFMELPDWLSYRCSIDFGRPESFTRSICSVVCKWGFDAEKSEWPLDLFDKFGLSKSVHKFGTKFASPGESISILSENVSRKLGLKIENDGRSTTIASPLIDAHAGMLSMLIFGDTSGDWENVLGIICGTSACHMLLNRERVFSKGIWGPYKNAIIPGLYLREAGQSATGKLIDDTISNYHQQPLKKTEIVDIIKTLNIELLNKNYHHKSPLIINPSFHGNRSPIGDSNLKGSIYGLTLEKTQLLDLYVGIIEALAYETRFILETTQSDDRPNVKDNIRKIIVTGGLVKNEFYMQTHSDILDCSLSTFSAGEADLMLVGASVIAYTASQQQRSNIAEMFVELSKMNGHQFQNNIRHYRPRKEYSHYHQKKYSSYRILLDCCRQLSNSSFMN